MPNLSNTFPANIIQGEELVTGSYDRTIRIFDRSKGHSRDIYHTKRMQRVFSCVFSQDNKYLLSGSDDGNIRRKFQYALRGVCLTRL